MIERDVVCRGCGYNLRSLPADGVCPECGVAVGFSLLPESLSLNEPKHFRMARVGVLLIIAIAAWEILTNVAWIFSESSNRPVMELLIWKSIPQLALFVAQAFATFALTAAARSSLRNVLFVLALLLAVLLLRFCVGWEGKSSGLCFVNELILNPVFNFLWLSYAEKFAENRGRHTLAKAFASLKWILPTLLAVNCLMLLLPIPWEIPMRLFTAIQVTLIVLNLILTGLFFVLHGGLIWKAPLGENTVPVTSARTEPIPGAASSAKPWSRYVSAGLLLEGAVLLILLLAHSLLFATSILHRAADWLFPARPVPRNALALNIDSVLYFILGGVQVLATWWITWPGNREAKSGGLSFGKVLRLLAAGSYCIFLVSQFAKLAAGAPLDAPLWIAAEVIVNSATLFCFGLFLEKELSPRVGAIDSGRQSSLLKWILPLISGGALSVLMILPATLSINVRLISEMFELQRLYEIVVRCWVVWIIFMLWRRTAQFAKTQSNAAVVI